MATMRYPSGGNVSGAVALSILAHGALVVWVARTPAQIPKEVNRPVEFEVMQVEAPPPPPAEPEPEPEPSPKPRAIAKAEPRHARPREALPPPSDPSSPPPDPAAAPTPIRIGVSLSSTTDGGGFAVGVGNSLHGKTESKAADPTEVKPHAAEGAKRAAFVPASQVTRLPTVSSIRKPVYPEKRRLDGIEGQVILQCRIDETGRVTEVRLIKGLGPDFDELAIQAMREARFKPAMSHGEPVSTELRYTLSFELD